MGVIFLQGEGAYGKLCRNREIEDSQGKRSKLETKRNIFQDNRRGSDSTGNMISGTSGEEENEFGTGEPEVGCISAEEDDVTDAATAGIQEKGSFGGGIHNRRTV